MPEISLQLIAKLEAPVREYLDAALSENTKRAYRADMQHFREWGGDVPCSPEVIASYLAAHAGTLTMATLARRLASVSKAHTMQGLSSPVSSDLVKMTFRGIRRQHGRPQRQAAPLLRDDLLLVLSAIPDDLRGLRDKALLLVGFCAALRRSELCRVRVEDLSFTSEGVILSLPRSKTDQTGSGREIAIPHGRGKVCPVVALKAWLEKSGITAGYVFRGVEKGAAVKSPLCDRSICNIVKACLAKAGFEADKFSGHSLRSGLATSAAQSGFSSWEIRRQTGHKSDGMLQRYIRIGGLFRNNAASLF